MQKTNLNSRLDIKGNTRKVIFALSSLLALTLFAAPQILVYAAENNTEGKPAMALQISPLSKRLLLNPGDQIDGDFTIQNVGSKEFAFKLSASPYNVVGDNANLNFSQETVYTQLSRWISFAQNSYTLSAGASQTVQYHIDVPSDVSGGGQYAVLFAEASGNGNSGGIKATSRVGMVLYARVSGETRESAEIKEYSFPSSYISFNTPKLTVSAKVKNAGNTDFQAKYHLQVDPILGGEPFYTKDDISLVLPESENKNEIIWENTPLLGIFNVTYTVKLPGSTTRSETKAVIIIPPWLIIIAVILFLSLSAWTIIRIRKYRQNRSNFRLRG